MLDDSGWWVGGGDDVCLWSEKSRVKNNGEEKNVFLMMGLVSRSMLRYLRNFMNPT